MSDHFGKYDVYAVASSLYCYVGTDVLRNRFGIRDKNVLHQIEADISAARQIELLESPVHGNLTVNHLCRIHRFLLGDIYPFAGHYRREDIAKGETRFLPYSQIDCKLRSLLGKLKEENDLTDYCWEQLISRSAWYLAELNFIHPFREGNGRATREFMRLIFLKRNITVDWAAVPTEELLQAMVDSVYDTKHLEQVLAKCLTQK